MYYIAELLSSAKFRFIGSDDNLERAKKIAYEHSCRTGLEVEVQNELGKPIDRIIAWRH